MINREIKFRTWDAIRGEWLMNNYLVGKKITGVQIASDKKALKFATEDGEVIARADGDCCSDTWIEHVELPALGFPAYVVSVDDLHFSDEEVEVCDVIAKYGCKIQTDKGDIVIDYRNESNGYYGGELVWPDERFYGGVFDQNVSNEEWGELT